MIDGGLVRSVQALAMVALLLPVVTAVRADQVPMAEASGPMSDHDAQQGAQNVISTVRYAVPGVTLIREDGRRVSLSGEIDDGRPVVLNFIFTTCGSICPLMSQVFGQFQRKLGAGGEHVHLMSISTDPEEDTPVRLREYAAKFGAHAGWNHYTGTLAASQGVQRAFGVYRGDKMSHTPVTLMRLAPDQPWLRIDGFATPDELLHHFNGLLAAR
jgi:protein SCO1/2